LDPEKAISEYKVVVNYNATTFMNSLRPNLSDFTLIKKNILAKEKEKWF